jgi:hypothetical protein
MHNITIGTVFVHVMSCTTCTDGSTVTMVYCIPDNTDGTCVQVSEGTTTY